MVAALSAAAIVLLFIAAIVLIVLIARSGRKNKSRVSFGGKRAKSMPVGTESSSSGDGEVTMRRRFFIFFGLIGAAVATLVAKLWSMQVMSGEDYTQQA